VLIVTLLAVRVIMKRPATGVALAWLLLITAAPLAGALIYLLIGERRISRDRARGIETQRNDYRKISEATIQEGLTDVDWSRHPLAVRGMNQLGRTMVGSPTVHGSSLQLFSDTQDILEAIARDVDAARTSVLIEFYIWNEGGRADEVLEAVIRAAKRGVSCRLLIDALGARPWWKGKQPQRLRDAGVDVLPALPVGLFRTLVGRTDLRLHRKIVVIDGVSAWTGSMNLVDPRFFKQDSGVGEWVDAMVRVQGSVVVPLAATMIGDWVLETGEPLADVITCAGLRLVEPRGQADIQVISSGPGTTGDGLLQMILALIHAAQDELVLTTPYLVPDDSLLRALRCAAGRGVTVRLIVPEKVDSFLTRYAGRSYYDDLLDIGVEIYLYRGGLLHTKSIMVDGAMSMFGTVNLDMRSFWLNYEVALFVYDREFAVQLRRLQQSYQDESVHLDPETWGRRSFGNRFIENTLRLVSPLL
jgi:cardiolipin synthase